MKPPLVELGTLGRYSDGSAPPQTLEGVLGVDIRADALVCHTAHRPLRHTLRPCGTLHERCELVHPHIRGGNLRALAVGFLSAPSPQPPSAPSGHHVAIGCPCRLFTAKDVQIVRILLRYDIRYHALDLLRILGVPAGSMPSSLQVALYHILMASMFQETE